MFRRLINLVIGFFLLLVIAAVLIPFLIPESFYREQAQIAASENLGRDVNLNGTVSLQIIPSVQITAQNVSIANAEGFGEAPFAEMSEMRVGVELLPLLRREIIITEFVLIDPAIRLEQRQGVNNWTLGSATQTQSSSSGNAFIREPGALPFEASLGDIRIENGSITYSDGVQTRQVEGLDLNIGMAGLDDPLTLNGALAVDGEAMTLAASLGSLRGFFEGDEVDTEIRLGGELIDLEFDGQVLEGQDIRLSGDVDANIPSIRALAAFAGAPLPDGYGLEQFRVIGRLTSVPGELSLFANGDGQRIQLDDISATGDFAIRTGGARPYISGSLALPDLDVTPYVPVAPVNESSQAGVPPWSTDRIDLSGLAAVDADLNLTVDRLQFQEMEISDAALDLEIENSRLEANLTQISLYEGSGNATVIANARTATPSFRIRADLESVAALPLLEAAAGFDRLSGAGRLTVDLLTSGNNQAELMNALSGNGNFAFSDGAIRGVNIAAAIRGIQSALTSRQLPDAFGDDQETDFSALNGSFTVANGVATNSDLLMLSPLLRVDGEGTVGIGAQSLDYRLRPRAVASIQGQGGDRDLQGIVIPILIRGTFNAPEVGIDWNVVSRALLQGAVSNAIGGTSPEDALRGAIGNALGLGGASDGEEAEEGGEDVDPAEALLRGLFGSRGSAGNDEEEDGGN